MKRQDKESKELQIERQDGDRNSSSWECSQFYEIEEPVVSDQKIDDLYGSLDRLREFVQTIPVERVGTVPACVEEYCDKISDYRINCRQEVVSVAQRRLNKMLRNKKIKRNWNTEDIALLVWTVSKRLEIQDFTHFSQMEKEDWEFISSLISGSTWQKCKFRWLSLKKVKLVSHKWSKNESELLSSLIAQNSRLHWKLIAEKLYEKNSSRNKVFRTPKQCREHWNCFLNPSIQKGPWTTQEDRRLLQYVMELEGSKKWSEISKFMEGRTQNALKNRFNLLMNRQKKLSGHLTQKRLVKACLNKLIFEESQQERPSIASPIAIEPLEERRQIPQRQISSSSLRAPIVPTVVEPVQPLTNNLSFNPNIGNFVGFMPSNIPFGSTNPIYISFMLPNSL